MSKQNLQDFAVAYSIFKMMEQTTPIKTNVFAKTLNVGFHVAKRVISNMAKSKLVKTQRGFTSKGVEKIQGVTIQDVFNLYNMEYKSDEEIAPLIKENVSHSRYRPKNCSGCGVEISSRGEFKVCKDCREVEEEAEPQVARMARCGHPSVDRYFKCTDCLPVLPEESWEDESYHSHF